MTPDQLQQWLDSREPGITIGPAAGLTVRQRLKAKAGTLEQQALGKLLDVVAPEPNSEPNKEPQS